MAEYKNRKVGKDACTFPVSSQWIYIRDVEGNFHHVVVTDNERKDLNVRLVTDNPKKEIEIF